MIALIFELSLVTFINCASQCIRERRLQVFEYLREHLEERTLPTQEERNRSESTRLVVKVNEMERGGE